MHSRAAFVPQGNVYCAVLISKIKQAPSGMITNWWINTAIDILLSIFGSLNVLYGGSSVQPRKQQHVHFSCQRMQEPRHKLQTTEGNTSRGANFTLGASFVFLCMKNCSSWKGKACVINRNSNVTRVIRFWGKYLHCSCFAAEPWQNCNNGEDFVSAL